MQTQQMFARQLENPVFSMSFQNQDKIQKLADSLKGTLDGSVDAIAEKIKTAQVFAEEHSGSMDEKNKVLKAKLVDFLRSAQNKGDNVHADIHQRISTWVSEIEKST